MDAVQISQFLFFLPTHTHGQIYNSVIGTGGGGGGVQVLMAATVVFTSKIHNRLLMNDFALSNFTRTAGRVHTNVDCLIGAVSISIRCATVPPNMTGGTTTFHQPSQYIELIKWRGGGRFYVCI